jgi:hypothetical protein
MRVYATERSPVLTKGKSGRVYEGLIIPINITHCYETYYLHADIDYCINSRE